MGTLTPPARGTVYVDAQVVIYAVQRHPVYAPVCRPIWEAARAQSDRVVSSELALIETLVAPLRDGDAILRARFETFLLHSDTRLLPVTQDILREGARLRASMPALKTPDAIHAATALLYGCSLFVSNDRGFRAVPGLPLALLDDVLAAP